MKSIEIPPPPQGLVSHEPINVINDNFTDYAFPGAGTKEDPYIIENYNITSYTHGIPGIYIENVKMHFTIQNCYIKAFDTSIEIHKANKGGCKIINNYIHDCVGGGLEVRHALNALIEGNIIINTMMGIYLDTTDGSVITENLCYQNTIKGISLFETDDCTIVNNTLAKNTEGISLGTASGCTVANNTIKANLEYCIRLFEAHRNILMYNTLFDNAEYGIYLRYKASGNTIHHNVFLDGLLPPISHANDEGTSNTWYDKETNEGNYWDDWSGSGSYQIDGSASSEDLYPLSSIPVFTGLGEIEDLFKISFSSFIHILLAVSVLALSLRFRKKRKN